MAPEPDVWVIATGNPGKRTEFEQILSDTDLVLQGLDVHPPVRFPEEGTDYRRNALEKARAVAEQLGCTAVADDSGIEVDALGGAPGPLSARYGGAGLDDRGRREKLLADLAEVEAPDRAARFVCYAALVTADGKTLETYGEVRGEILTAAQGRGGFGYDPIFRPEGYALSMGQIETPIKNRISHRALALRELYARYTSS